MRQNSRYSQCFDLLKASNRKAVIPFTLLGWPNRETSQRIIQGMIAGGASALELGLAFSDPMSDGKIIQDAASETLASGFRVEDAFQLLREIRLQHDRIPIGLLVYYNLVLARGIERFFRELSIVGVDGILIPDLPPEAAEEVAPAARNYGIDLIFIVSPLTTDERLSRIRVYADGFLYAVSRLGITGTEERYDPGLANLIHRAQEKTSLPVCVGFGISTPEQVKRMINQGADGVVIGSRIIQRVRETTTGSIETAVASFVESLLHAANSNPEIACFRPNNEATSS